MMSAKSIVMDNSEVIRGSHRLYRLQGTQRKFAAIFKKST